MEATGKVAVEVRTYGLIEGGRERKRTREGEGAMQEERDSQVLDIF